jgi:hypothetical protein
MRRRSLLALVGLLAVSTLGHIATAQTGRRCFPDVPGIANCIEGRFRQYWEANGGLAVFGYPITGAQNERNRDTGVTYLTQWFERNRFELHPENRAPYDVLLGRLGDDRLRQQGRDWQTFPPAEPTAAHFFSESRHAIAHEPFWRYWSTHGLEFDGRGGTSMAESLALFGLPISEPRQETNSSGDTVLTQWFERARFEDHGGTGVLLGLLGNELRARGPAPAPTTAAPTVVRSTPTPTPRAVSGKVYPPPGSSTGLTGGIWLPDAAVSSEEPLEAVFRDRIDFAVEVYPTGEYAGVTIEEVAFFIYQVDPSGVNVDTLVHERVERDAEYCPFGGGEPDCTVWVFADHGGRWPNGRQVNPGSHRVQINITARNTDPPKDPPPEAFWNFEFTIEEP